MSAASAQRVVREGRRAAPPPARDQATSTFTHILERLLAATPGARAAALVDFEGETVDYAGSLDPFDLKIAAAHWLIVLSEIAATQQAGVIQQVCVRAHRHGYFVRRLEEDYAVVLVLHPRAAFAVSDRAVEEAIARLSLEAGWPVPKDAARWFCVEVTAERRGHVPRPVKLKVAGSWQPVDVLGTMVGLKERERGFRVRLSNGREMMLLRERLGQWFADEPVE